MPWLFLVAVSPVLFWCLTPDCIIVKEQGLDLLIKYCTNKGSLLQYLLGASRSSGSNWLSRSPWCKGKISLLDSSPDPFLNMCMWIILHILSLGSWWCPWSQGIQRWKGKSELHLIPFSFSVFLISLQHLLSPSLKCVFSFSTGFIFALH